MRWWLGPISSQNSRSHPISGPPRRAPALVASGWNTRTVVVRGSRPVKGRLLSAWREATGATWNAAGDRSSARARSAIGALGARNGDDAPAVGVDRDEHVVDTVRGQGVRHLRRLLGPDLLRTEGLDDPGEHRPSVDLDGNEGGGSGGRRQRPQQAPAQQGRSGGLGGQLRRALALQDEAGVPDDRVRCRAAQAPSDAGRDAQSHTAPS